MNDVDAVCSPITKSGAKPQNYASNRRLVTEDEIKNALLLAQAASTDESFLIVMRPTHVYKRFFVVNVYIANFDHIVILVCVYTFVLFLVLLLHYQLHFEKHSHLMGDPDWSVKNLWSVSNFGTKI